MVMWEFRVSTENATHWRALKLAAAYLPIQQVGAAYYSRGVIEFKDIVVTEGTLHEVTANDYPVHGLPIHAMKP